MTYTQALLYYKSNYKMAQVAGCSKQNVTRWRYDGIPHHHQKTFQVHSEGHLKADKTRILPKQRKKTKTPIDPDIYWRRRAEMAEKRVRELEHKAVRRNGQGNKRGKGINE